MKMFEYMASGRAIVSADLPVIREVLNEKNAVFCKPDDASDWRLVIESLLEDEAHRITLGGRARQDAQGYTWVARARRIMNGFP
jgi:glycosyltransferase involved in cell wall biosynthesis